MNGKMQMRTRENKNLEKTLKQKFSTPFLDICFQ